MTSRRPTTAPSRQKATVLPLRERNGGSRHTVKTLNDSDIEGILDSVGARHMPPALDRQELLHDLNSAWTMYQSYERSKLKPYHAAIRKYTNEVATAANALSEILDQSNEAADYFRRAVSIGAQFPLNDFRIRLQRLPKLAVATEQAFSGPRPATYDDDGPQTPGLRLSPKEFFLAYQLPSIFKKHFEREAGQSRSSDGGPPDGPFIRFAEAVSAAFGQNAARGSIGRAMTKVSKGVFPR